jgi:WD40 repeat protein
MGVVWRAQQEHPIRRIVAVKVVKPGGDSRQVLSRFESERQSLALLNHPNIATVFDAGVSSDGRPYFVMEYVAGSSITTFADQHALAIPARLELFMQVCEGVQHAHQKGLLHRDLKPSNILVTDQDGRAVVKIIDFGIAKAMGPRVAAETVETQMGILLGTPEYMSPEQAGLSEAHVDTRTDIYSLGVLLYELLVGARPFDARELRRNAIVEMLRVIREEEPPRLTARLTSQSDAEIHEIARRRLTEPRTLVRQLRGDLEWITNRALEKEPTRRYPSASELRLDLRRHLSNEPVLAGPPDLRYRLAKLARKHRTGAIAAGLVLAAVFVGAVVSTALWISADRARRENRERLKTLHVATGLQLATDGEDLKALPWLVRALQLEEGGQRAEESHRIRIRHVLDRSPSLVRLWHHADIAGAYLSPDRTSLATWDRQGTVKVWDPLRGVEVGPPLAHAVPLVDVRLWQTIVVTADERGVIRVWNARTGAEALPSLTHEGGLQFVRVSGAANRLLSADRRGGIRLWALDSGRLVAMLQLKGPPTVAEFLDGGYTAAAGDVGGSLLMIDSATGKTRFEVPHVREVVNVAPAANNRLFTATGDGVIRLWNVPAATIVFESAMMMASGIREARAPTQRPVAFACGARGGAVVRLERALPPQPLSEHGNCTSLDVSDDGLLVALGYGDGSLRAWRTNTAEFASGPSHAAGVVLTRFLGESRLLLSVDGAGVVRLWDLGAAAAGPTLSSTYSYASIFSPDGRHIGLANGSTFGPSIGAAAVIDAASGEAMLPPLRHGGVVRSIAFSPDGRSIATGSNNGTARIWDRATGEPAANEMAPTGRPIELFYSADGERLLALEADQEPIPASLWDSETGRRIASLPETGAVYVASFSPDGKHVQTVTRPAGRVQVWRTSDGQPVNGADWAPFDTAAFRSNTEVVMVGAQSIEVRALDGKAIATYPAGVRDAESVSVTTDGATFVVGTASGTTHVFTLSDSLARPYPPLRLPGPSVAAELSYDNRWVLGVSFQRQMRVWSVQTGEPITPQRMLSTALPLSAAFSPTGPSFLVSGPGAQRWDLHPDLSSIDMLEKLAQLFSGHELTGSDLGPLPANRLIALAEDRELASAISASDPRNWQWMVAQEHLTRRNWGAAEPVLATLTADPRAIWEMHAAHGHALAELGRWAESAEAFGKALARRPDWTELIYYEALARAGGGDAGAIDAACTAALQKFGATRNPDRAHWLAGLCALATGQDDGRSARVRDLAQIAAAIEPDLERFVTVYATALLRANDPSRAAAVIEQVLKRPVAGPRGAETLLVYALIQRGLRHSNASSRTLARYEASPLRATMPWHRRLEAETWLRAFRAGQ